MKIRYFLAILVCFVTTALHAQASIINEIDNDLLQKYIMLARQNYPRKKIFDAHEVRAKANLTTSQVGLLDIFNGAYIYRPDQKSSINVDNPYYVNGFQFGISMNLGNFLSKPSQIKGAKADYEAAKAENAEYNISLATEVKTRYYDYILMKKQLELRTLSAQTLKTLLSDAQQKYGRGEVTIDSYTTSKNASSEADVAAIAAEIDYLKAKNALEDLIGTKLENVK